MNLSFKIGDTDFGTGKVVLKIDAEKSILSKLEIHGNKKRFDEITSDEDGDWSWAMYPLKFYVYELPFEKGDDGIIRLEIDENTLEEHDVALYLMEHNDFLGKLAIEGNEVEITGTVDIMGEEYPLAIRAEGKT